MAYYGVGYRDAMAVPVSRRYRWILLAEEARKKAEQTAGSGRGPKSGGLAGLSPRAAGRR